MTELYMQLIKKVHPDINPDLSNAHIITCEINAHKNNDSMLQLIGIKYGLLPAPEGFKPQPQPEETTVFVVDVGMVIRVVSVVRRRRHYVNGTVVEIRTITRGKNEGLKEVTFVNLVTGKIMTTILSNHVGVIRKANPDEYDRCRKIAIKEAAISIKPTHIDFWNVGLVQKVPYTGKGARYKNSIYKVVKTTAMYVYLESLVTGKTIKVYPQSLDCEVFDLI